MFSSRLILLLFMVLVAIIETFASDWCYAPTEVDVRWKRRCKRRQFVSTVDSFFNKSSSDRIWRICCRDLPVPEEDLAASGRCKNWTGYINVYGGVMDFVCPGNGYIAGLRSHYSSERGDRVFRFKCCYIPDYIMDDCRTSGLVNWFNQKVSYTTPQGRALIGMGSVFRDHYKDRLFEFKDCVMRKRI